MNNYAPIEHLRDLQKDFRGVLKEEDFNVAMQEVEHLKKDVG